MSSRASLTLTRLVRLLPYTYMIHGCGLDECVRQRVDHKRYSSRKSTEGPRALFREHCAQVRYFGVEM